MKILKRNRVLHQGKTCCGHEFKTLYGLKMHARDKHGSRVRLKRVR
jgi:hypothetical protein